MTRLASKGFTVVELMVALGLGMLLSLAAVQLFISNQVSVNFQRGMSDVQAGGRFALDRLAKDLRMAGYGGEASPIKPFSISSGDIPGSTVVSGNDGATGLGLSNQDAVVLEYATIAAGVDCEGNSVPAGQKIVARYFIRTDADTNLPGLACDGGYHDDTTTTGLNGSGTILVSGVDSFQVLYGVDDGVNGTPRVTRYVTAADLTASTVVVAVRVGLLMRSQAPAQSSNLAQQVAAPFYVLDKAIALSGVPVDGNVRRLFTTTVALRNSSPAEV